MIRLFQSTDKLEQYLPSFLRPAMESASLFNRIERYIELAEHDVRRKITGTAIFNLLVLSRGEGTEWQANYVQEELDHLQELLEHTLSVIALMALIMAIPSLDVVFTPQGFGVISSEKTAPASKERVQNLITSLREMMCMDVDSMISKLRKFKVWFDSDEAKSLWTASFFSDLSACDFMCIPKADRFDSIEKVIRKAAHVEHELSYKFFSHALMDALRDDLHKPTQISDKCRRKAVSTLRSIIGDALANGKYNIDTVLDLICYIKDNISHFREFIHTTQFRSFTVNIHFENKKDSSGYVF